uniref:ZP domain-containing protein n=3 Tax=Sphaeramia orbicularis TaxID=375764 RepID=A0A673A289_9TELE
MEAGTVLLILVALFGVAAAQDFYGDSISFMPLKKKQDGTIQVTFYNRENGRTNCPNQVNYTCDSGACTSIKEGLNLQTDHDNTGQNRWCQSEGKTTVTVSTNKTSFSLSDSGCCWLSGTKTWTTHAELDVGTRSDTHGLNSCPVTTTVAALRVPQNCFSRLHLLAHDPDGDDVKCRFAGNSPANFTLDETKCMLTKDGDVSVGVHVFELMLEDFPTKNITLSYQDGSSVFHDASDVNSNPLCSVKLQFSLEVLPPLANCKAGHIQPMFLSKTPSHGDVLHASVGHMFHLHAEAQAHHSSIHTFQVSGPQNMTKQFTDKAHGKAGLTLSWMPHETDVYRFVPVCFTAETNETQSEMRCVIVMVTRSTIVQGKASVTCGPNKMTVALDKASMPGIDENFLMLRDKSCSLTSNGTHIMGSMSFSTCGTKLEDKGDFIVFENEIDSFELPTEVITRRKKVKIGFSCQFPKTVSISSYYNLHKTDYIFTESSFGSFGYAFEIYQDNNFTDKVSASEYPVEVNLLEMVYLGIEASSDVPNVTLFVESCKATPDDNPDNSLSYDLIKDG